MAYTTIDDPSAHFLTTIYTGDGNDNRSITNDANAGDFKADWIWAKQRDTTRHHQFVDSSRGVTKYIQSSLTNAESTNANAIQAFETDGFQLGTDPDINQSSGTYVAWQWKANGGTTSSNSNGTNITSTVQANTTAGFSIVTFTGTGNDGDSYGHGLSSAPELVIPKRRDGSTNWQSYAFDDGNSQYWYLNLTNAFVSTSGNSAASSSSVITTDGSGDANPSGGTVVSYCFHSVQGYSKIGRYTGNGNEDGPFVYLGFKPQWIFIKNTGAAEEGYIYDTTRDSDNPITKNIRVDSSIAEADASALDIDFLGNGFKNRSDNAQLNSSGVAYFYMAFAEHPFVSSEGVPVTAR